MNTKRKQIRESSDRLVEQLRDYYLHILEILKECNYQIPYGRFRDAWGIEKYDDPDGYGPFKLTYSEGYGITTYYGNSGPIIPEGEYMITREGLYTVTSEELKEYSDIVKYCSKVLKRREIKKKLFK